jgi:hypothetical protein
MNKKEFENKLLAKMDVKLKQFPPPATEEELQDASKDGVNVKGCGKPQADSATLHKGAVCDHQP